MEKMRIVICDENKAEADGYTTLCRTICDTVGIPVEIKAYTTVDEFLFDSENDAFASLVSILIVEPEGAFASIPVHFRKAGYDGLILYLSRSTKPQHWIQGYDVGAFNYVFKGADEKSLTRFHAVFKKAMDAAKQLVRQYIVLSSAGVYKQIEIKDIYFFESIMEHVICVQYQGGKFEFRSDIKKLEERLCGRGFVRTHRSYVVAIDAIHSVGFSELKLNDGRMIPIGRSYFSAMKETIEQWKL